MADQAYPLRLRLITYLSPSIPIEYFEMLKEYLEEKLQCYVYIICESRWSGPQRTALTRSQWGRRHSKRFKEFQNLRGSRWAYNDDYSLSGCLITLQELRKIGENAHFFGNIVQSGSHVKSIQMVLNKTVEGAAIDSTVLAMQMKANPEMKDKLHIVTSWGPLPVYAVVVNSKLSEELKKSIATHFLNMHQEPKWQACLKEFMVSKFVPVTMDNFQEEDKVRKEVQEMSMTDEVYY